jgi:hypothetical protein
MSSLEEVITATAGLKEPPETRRLTDPVTVSPIP